MTQQSCGDACLCRAGAADADMTGIERIVPAGDAGAGNCPGLCGETVLFTVGYVSPFGEQL